MKDFLAINKRKIFFQLQWSAFLTFLVWLFLLIKEWNTSEPLNPAEILLGLVYWVVVLPIGAQLIISLIDLMKWSQADRILDSEPINQLKVIGFIKCYSYKDDRWESSIPVLVGEIDSYPVKCEAEGGIARVIAATDLELVEKAHWKKLASIYGRNRIENGLPGVALVYNALNRKSLTSQEFVKEVQSFIDFLRTEKLYQSSGNSSGQAL